MAGNFWMSTDRLDSSYSLIPLVKSVQFSSGVSDDALDELNGLCGLRTFQWRQAAIESNQSLTGSLWQTDASGYLDVLIISESPFVMVCCRRPSKWAQASTRASGETATCEHTHTHTHPFNGPYSRTTRVHWYQKGKTNLLYTEARDSEWQCHQLGHMQVCTSLQTDYHASTAPLKFFTGRMPFLPPNRQHQSTEGKCSLPVSNVDKNSLGCGRQNMYRSSASVKIFLRCRRFLKFFSCI